MKNKKAQLKIQQMAFMLIAVFLFFIFVILFFVSIRFASLQQDVIDQQREEALAIVSKIAEMPEFSCPWDRLNCVDADKAMALKDLEAYEEFFPVDSIIIRKIYPETTEIDCNRENYPDCNVIKILQESDVEPISTFVALCRKDNSPGFVYDKCELAMLSVGFSEDVE